MEETHAEARKKHNEKTKPGGKEQTGTLSQRRHHGLINQGATCYLNSVLQVLFMTTEFNDRLDPDKQTDLQLRKVFEGLKKRTCRTENIRTTFGIKNVYQQRDAAECLDKILHQVSTKASEVFKGQLRETTKCSRGHMINEKTTTFSKLLLSLDNTYYSTYSVESSFERIFQERTYTGNKMYCNECYQNTEATSGWEMLEAPQVLIVLFKRFNITSLVKSDCCVEVPCELQLKNKTYTLYGMVNHVGSIRGGRYTATVLSEDNTWYKCNDERVNKVEEQPFAKARTFSSRTVYLLTYRVTPPQRRHHGLYNQGATCDLNSVLQVLFMTTEFNDRLDPEQQTDLQLRKIFEDLKKTTCGTENIRTTFGIKNVYQQRDAAECLEEILRLVSTKASEIFQGQLKTTTKCSRGHMINEETTTFWKLLLSLKDSTYSVESSFERIFQERTYTGNKVYCNKCFQHTEATSGWEMVEAPQILIVLFKRFDITSHFKSDCSVEVPCELQLKNKTYTLYGMVDHMGSIRGGPYTATVLSEDNTWYECNDERVNKVEEQPFAKARTFSSRTVCLLTYRATELKMSRKMRQDETKSKNSREQRLDEETTKEREGLGVTQTQKRHHGLYNQGATCYLNSVLQVLFMTTEIHDRLDPQTNQELIKIFTDLETKTCGTVNITKSLEIHNVYEQRDAAECLQKILHHISPQASEVFQGQLMDTTKCSEGHIINKETNPFWILPLSLKDTRDTTYSVKSSFERTFQTKTYSGDNMVYCNDCKQKTGATSGCEMVETPQILIVLLKRFDFDYNTRSHFKSDCCVEVPCELQLKNKTYKLYGMVDHMGSIRGGRYTATVLSEDNTWYKCNDSHVSKVEEQPFTKARTFSSRTVYLLTYRATEVKMSCKMRQDETKSKNSREQRLDEETTTEREGLGVTQTQKRHHGLYNQGATCYLNSVLQVLFMTTEIHNRLDPQTNQELRKIFTDLKRKTCRTVNITKSLEIHNVYEQRDAAECLQKILDHISPQASEVFQGQLMDTTKCSEGHIINNETNPFWILPLSLKDTRDTTYSVKSSFERTFQTKTYSGDNMVYCNDCKQKTGATSGCEMVKAPQILIVLLKRFDFDYNTRSHFKSDCCVEVPCELLLKNKTYKLYGMVNHMGSIRGGHYTATVLSEDNTWYECYDERVSKMKYQLFAEDRTFSSRTVYLLTYRATELKMSCDMRQNEEDEVQTGNDNEVSNHQTEGEEENTEENSNDKSVNVRKQSKDYKRHLDEDTTTDREGQRAPKKPHVTTIPSQTDDAAERRDETSEVDDQMQAEVEYTRKDVEMDTNDEEKRQMGHSDVVTQTQKRHHGLYNQGATCYLNSVLQDPEKHDRNRTVVEDASEQLKDSCEQHLDEETKTGKEEQRATECQKPEVSETTSEDLTEVKEEQGENVDPEELKEDEEPKSKFCERNTDDEETTEMGHSAEDEGQMRKDRKEERPQASGEEGDAENVETDTSINNQTTVSQVKSSAGEEAQEHDDSNTRENSKSEELNETRVEDASVNVEEQSRDSCEQHLDEETKTEKEEQRAKECQKPVETTSEDPTDEVEEEEGEDIGPEDLKGHKEPKRNSKKNTDDEETTQMGHSAEDEGQMRKDRKEERLQASGEEGDAENVETDTSINNQSTVSQVKSSAGEEAQEHEDSNTRENSKSEELNETRVEEASVNVEEQSRDSCEQHLDEETKTEKEEQRAKECQKPGETTSEDPTDEVEEEEGEDIGPEDLKGHKEPKRNSKKNTDDEETTQMGHSAEDEGQMRKDREEEGLQASGEEGDAENVETDTSINNQSTVSEVKSSEDEEAQENEDSNTRENSKSEELNETRVEEASVNVEEQSRDSCEQHLDEETKTEKEEQRAKECQKPGETTSEDPTDEVEEEEGEDIGPEDLKEDEEPKRNSKKNTDDEETTEMGHSAEDEGQMRKDRKEERPQASGEEGDAENVETDTSINNQTTVSQVKSSAGEEAQEHDDSNTRENSKSEELNETRVEDASVNVGEQSRDSCEQHLDEETKTAKEEQRAKECQKPVETTSEDPTDEVEEEEGEDIGPEDLKGHKEPKRNSKKNTDDEETTEMGHSAEDEGQMRKDREEEGLQASGEEGDAENVETDTSINNQSTVSEVKSSEDEEAQENEDSNTRENSKSEELNETRVEDASANVEEQSKDSCEQHLDEETKTEKEEQRAKECQKPGETTSEDPTDEVEEEEGEDIGPEDLKEDEEPKRNSKKNTDDEETTEMGHSAEDEGQMRKDREEERPQASGEEGDAENVETDTSINNQTTVSEVKSSEDEEEQENEDSNTRENSKSEELNERRVEDASVNVGEQSKDSCEQHLDEETKTEKEEQRVTQTQKRHHGLYNQGATCYLNSVLQVLFMTTEIHDRLDPQTNQELIKIFTDLETKTCGTVNITKSLEIHNVYEQRDAAECLQKILHHISPQASEVFQGQLMDTTKCSEGHIINNETNPFWILPLSLKDTPDTTYSVQSSFERTFQTKTYSGDNMVYCNDCKQKTGATSGCEMVKAPQILILLVKRFDFDYNTRSHFKSDCCVEVPCELQSKNKTYKLYGMVDHMGSIRGGHYTATVLSEDNTWYKCNDSHVSKMINQLFAEDRTFSSRTVYLLTYRDADCQKPVETNQNEDEVPREQPGLPAHSSGCSAMVFVFLCFLALFFVIVLLLLLFSQTSI
ncbi:uncharacterized protein [Pagrus major]|uniref:uncharacterized protein n=1 Tax=Pagrus major TaxID=143350 RepID=UPI003CC8B8DB